MEEFIFKVLVVGNAGVGKTSLIRRYVHDMFSTNYKTTIGVDFALKRINWTDGSVLQLHLWDIAGQERFGNMTRVYYKQAVAAIVVFDITDAESFEGVKMWKKDIDSKVFLPDDQTPIPTLLIANKYDLENKIDIDLDEFCKENNFIGYHQTSALSGDGVDNAMNVLITKILENKVEVNEPSSDTGVIRIEETNPNDDKKSSGGCQC
eukprot:gene357-6771_t